MEEGLCLPMVPHCIQKVRYLQSCPPAHLSENSRQRWTQPAVLTPSQLSFLRNPNSNLLLPAAAGVESHTLQAGGDKPDPWSPSTILRSGIWDME
ncbi:hypothetical protein CSPX01_09843 [Colletotrichum filicis]|nr:hypothetical protein CSPX01_09843 [Colletotrichum filicis]